MTDDTTRRIGIKVLIIDDSELVLDATKLMLEERGCEVVCVNTPIGVGLVALQEKPDIVLMDLEMASMSGAQAASSLKRQTRGRKMPVIIYSEQPLERLREAAQACSADGYMQKTGDPDQLCLQLERWLREASEGDPA